MKFIIKHESRGRMRVQLCQSRMTLAPADLLQAWLHAQPHVLQADVHERTCCAVVTFRGDCREQLLSSLRRFSYSDKAVQAFSGIQSGRAINRAYQEKLVGLVCGKAARSLFLPAPLQAAWAVVTAVPYVLRGLGCLIRRQMHVELLDGLSIGISLVRRDFGTAGSVMFLLRLGELLEEWTHKRSVDNLARSMSLNIDRVWLKTPGGDEILVPLTQVQPGDRICVRTGGMIPLDSVVDQIVSNADSVQLLATTKLYSGVSTVPLIKKDATDRNRTSPFAFTGNKFEFRMVGSSDSIACANIMLNASMAETLKEFADKLEGASNFESALHDLIKETIKAHKRIIFNGNGYDDAWIKEATDKRGLLNLRTTPDALATILEKKNVDMLTSLKVFSEAEIRSRYEICLENYCKTVNIEGLTMVDMARKEILPAVEAYLSDLSGTVAAKAAAVPGLACKYEKGIITKLSTLVDEIDDAAEALDSTLVRLKAVPDVTDAAYVIRDVVLQKMAELRVVCDEAEALTAAKYWPFPTYGDLLFGVR